MKKLVIVLSLLVSQAAFAQLLEAKPVSALFDQISKAELVFKENGMSFGFDSIQSCLFIADDLAILKNYCIPKKKYPARGLTIISPKFGIIELYEENLGPVLKRDIRIETFPEVLRQYLKIPLKQATLADLNKVLEALYYKFGDGCWSTNFSQYTESPEAKCTTSEVQDFASWAAETQSITLDEKTWLTLMEKLNAVLPVP